jgi:beta-N-acetylhexosaminidase
VKLASADVPFLAALQAAVALVGTVQSLTPLQKARLVVVSGLPAAPGVAGVIVQRWNHDARVPPRTLVFVDQEGGPVRAFRDLSPSRPASAYTAVSDAFVAGADTGRALRQIRVAVDLAPVLDSPDGPLGSRHFRRARFGVAFANGLASVGVAACAKHFPGLGSAPISTDESVHVDAVVRPAEVAGFRAAVRAGVPCVMVGHAFYRTLGPRRASLEPATYRLLRSTGFRGVTITDSLNIVRHPPPDWPVRASRAGADLLLYTSPAYAQRAIQKLIPLARRGELDEHVARVLRFRATYLR